MSKLLNIKLNNINTSIFNKLELTEQIDELILENLINSDVLQTTSWMAGNVTFENEKHQLQQLQKMTKKGILKVVYKLPKYGRGRVYPQKGLSLCSLRRQIRHTIAINKYIDIDIVNCHPEILLQICEHNKIKTRFLKQYVLNRDEILEEVQQTYNCSRDNAKLLFIILAYYGSFSNWIDDEEIEPTPFILDYINELQYIGQQIILNNPELVKVVKDCQKKNEKASVVSIFLQEKEREILETVYNYLIKKKIIKKDCVLCFDGIMIPINNYKVELLEELTTAILSTTGFKLKFTQKEMNDNYLNDLEDVGIDEESFEYKSVEFEKTHCKIINKSIYIKQTSEDIIIFSKGKLREAYEHLTCGEDKNGNSKLFIDQWTTGNANIRKYDDINTYPNPLICPNNIFNLWSPFECEKYTDNYIYNEEAVQIMLSHIKILCDNDDIVSDYFIKWIGQMIQYPAIKTICPTLISKEGAGKGTLIKLISKMLGKKKVLETTDPLRDIWGNFNGQMINSFFVNLNELSKKDTLESQGKIKGLITDTSLTINSKGKDQFEINSYHRFIITTNKEDPIATSQDDRRNLIIRSSDELIGNKEYFVKLNLLLDDLSVIRSCYHYFKNIPDLDKFNSLPIPKTSYQNNLKLLNLTAPEQFLIHFCSDKEGIVEVENKEFFNQFLQFIDSNNIEYNTTSLKFGVKISNMKINGVDKGKHTKKGDYRNIDISKVNNHFNIIQCNDPFEDEIPPLTTNKTKKKTSNSKTSSAFKSNVLRVESNDPTEEKSLLDF